MSNLHFQEAGQGTPLILLHAFPLSSELWRPQLETLSNDFRVIAPDLPGFGNSPDFVEDASVDHMANSVMALLQQLKIEEPIILGGLSMGGYTALAFARLFPESLRALILCDTRAEADTEEGKAGRDKTIALAQSQGARPIVEQMLPKLLGETSQKERVNMMESVRTLALQQSPTGIANALRALRDRPDSLDLLPQINVPTLVIVGEEDTITPVSMAQTLANKIPNARLEIIPQAGHLSNIEQPEVFNRIVCDFCQSL
jgi:pimeloyl-ACP methyl ester carboxylesterase